MRDPLRPRWSRRHARSSLPRGNGHRCSRGVPREECHDRSRPDDVAKQLPPAPVGHLRRRLKSLSTAKVKTLRGAGVETIEAPHASAEIHPHCPAVDALGLAHLLTQAAILARLRIKNDPQK